MCNYHYEYYECILIRKAVRRQIPKWGTDRESKKEKHCNVSYIFFWFVLIVRCEILISSDHLLQLWGQWWCGVTMVACLERGQITSIDTSLAPLLSSHPSSPIPTNINQYQSNYLLSPPLLFSLHPHAQHQPILTDMGGCPCNQSSIISGQHHTKRYSSNNLGQRIG